MVSVPQVAAVLQAVLTTQADAAARETGFIQRERKLTGATFVQALVLAWLENPAASDGQLVQLAGSCGVAISAQGLEQRFSERSAACLRQVLAQALWATVQATPVALRVLRRFSGVYLWDSTTIRLPDVLGTIWPGCGGRVATNTQAGLKVQVRWEYSTGALEWVDLEAGRDSDRTAALAAPALPRGALRVTDLGYVVLSDLRTLLDQGVYGLSRLPVQPAVFEQRGRRWPHAAAYLQAQGTAVVERASTLGVEERIPCRLLAVRVPPAQAAERRDRWRKEATREGHQLSDAKLAMADWDAWITTAPRRLLSLPAAIVLAGARRQIELLFKLWKSQGGVDEWRSAQPWRILTEVSAKLLAMLIQHWCFLLACWDDPCRSLVKAAAVVRTYAILFATARGQRRPLCQALHLLAECLAHAGGLRLDTSRCHPSTAHRLLDLDAHPCLN